MGLINFGYENVSSKKSLTGLTFKEKWQFEKTLEDLKTIYVVFIRSVPKQFAKVWHSGLSKENVKDLGNQPFN